MSFELNSMVIYKPNAPDTSDIAWATQDNLVKGRTYRVSEVGHSSEFIKLYGPNNTFYHRIEHFIDCSQDKDNII